MTPRDATRFIRSVTRNNPPEKLTATSDWEAYEAEKRHSSGWVPSPDEIIAERDKIRAEHGDVQAAISELVAEPDAERRRGTLAEQ